METKPSGLSGNRNKSKNIKRVNLSNSNSKNQLTPMKTTQNNREIVLSDISAKIKPSGNTGTANFLIRKEGVKEEFMTLAYKPEHTNRTYKIVICGDAGVGKSCIFQRFLDDMYAPLGATIGVDFRTKHIMHTLTQEIVQINCWDTAGQEKFRSIVRNYFRGAHGIMLVFDITSIHTFIHIEMWIEEARMGAPNVSMILVGNKAESEKDRVVSFEDASAFAHKVGIPYIETSAKTGLKVNEAFYQLIDRMWEVVELPNKISKGYRDSTDLDASDPQKIPRNTFCCT